MKQRCERCGAALMPDAEAYACTYECTFCRACTDSLALKCPNCGGLLADRRRATIVVATPTEALAVSRAMPAVRLYETGIALAKTKGPFGDRVVSCGLAGGLRLDVPSGAVLVPREVRRPDGSTLQCDAEMSDRLAGAARLLGFEPIFDPLLTSGTLVNGDERERWADAGYAGVDMETGLLEATHVAVVRVVLDTPARELSADWLDPKRALRRARNWPQLFWLAWHAPRYARRAASIVAAAGV